MQYAIEKQYKFKIYYKKYTKNIYAICSSYIKQKTNKNIQKIYKIKIKITEEKTIQTRFHN